jgi:hypothetical protein
MAENLGQEPAERKFAAAYCKGRRSHTSCRHATLPIALAAGLPGQRVHANAPQNAAQGPDAGRGQAGCAWGDVRSGVARSRG